MFGKNSSKITFYYDSDKLFNDVSLMTAYMTKNMLGDSGNMMDEFNISDDERDIYEVCVRQTLPNIYETMMKITSDKGDAFRADYEVAKYGERNKTEEKDAQGNVTNEYEALVNISNGVDTGAKANTLGRFAGIYVEFTIQDNTAYNANVLNIVDATLLNCLKHGIVAEFYSICVNGDLYKLAQDKFNTSLFQLKQRLFQLKKKVVSSQLS